MRHDRKKLHKIKRIGTETQKNAGIVPIRPPLCGTAKVCNFAHQNAFKPRRGA